MTMMQAETQRKEKQVDPQELDELWGLWIETCWCRAMDEAGDPILVYFSREAAEEGARAHRDIYEIESVPMRLK